MKKIKIIFIVSFLMIFTLHAQKLNKKIIDIKTDKEILIGKCNLKGLKADTFGLVFKEEYKNYLPDSSKINILQSKMKSITIEIVMGTWCGDSKEQVPRFIKVLDAINYKTKKINFLCLDHFFKADDFEKEKNNIQKVPTFIIYRKQKEIGRIVETPTKSLEEDLLDIVCR
ncbi:MAG: thioredoxin family protein [Bacteroidales bacterium]